MVSASYSLIGDKQDATNTSSSFYLPLPSGGPECATRISWHARTPHQQKLHTQWASSPASFCIPLAHHQVSLQLQSRCNPIIQSKVPGSASPLWAKCSCWFRANEQRPFTTTSWGGFSLEVPLSRNVKLPLPIRRHLGILCTKVRSKSRRAPPAFNRSRPIFTLQPPISPVFNPCKSDHPDIIPTITTPQTTLFLSTRLPSPSPPHWS